MSVTKRILVGPITLERHCNDAIAHNAIPGALVSAKIVIQKLDQYSVHLVCGAGDNNHRGPFSNGFSNEMTNRERFLDVPTLKM